MTKFEVSKMQSMLDYLYNRINNHYDTLFSSAAELQDDPAAFKRKLSAKKDRELESLQEFENALRDFGFLEESNAALDERIYTDSEMNHTYILKATWLDGNSNFYKQEGRTSGEAERFLRSHILFEKCANEDIEEIEKTLKIQCFAQLN